MPMLASDRGRAAVAALEANRVPLPGRTWAEFGDSAFWAEGMDVDPRSGHAYVGSIRHRTIAEVAKDGRILRTLPAAGSVRIGAIFGVRVDAKRGVLWATTSGLKAMQGFTPADSGIASLLRIRLSDGVVEKRYDLPPAPEGHILGDVAVAANGDVFMTDSNEPVLYRLRASADSLERYSHPLFRSLQGMAPTTDGKFVYVADWSHGLLRVDLTTRVVVRLTDAPNSSSLGCDGIVLYGNAIIAVQNGAVPNRVMRYTLDASGTGIARADVLDRASGAADAPTIGTIVGNEFVFVANSQWEKYDDNGARLPNTSLARPLLRAIRIRT
jgi:sugar lactone lactonase YvrE